MLAQETAQFQKLLAATSFASRKHSGQVRADGVTPYITHIFRVTLILRHHFDIEDDTVLIITLLHDTLEDTDTDIEELTENFGEEIAKGVVLLSKNSLLPKKEREIDYLAKLSKAPEMVKIAKLADIYDNLSARVGTEKMPKTLENASRIVTTFEPLMTSDKGRGAVKKVRALLSKNLQIK